jgi:hypothetical protein
MPVRIHKALWPQPASLSLRATMAPTALLLLLLCTAAATASLFRIPLDTNSTFSWTLDYPAGTVSVEVHSPAERDHWVAVGFSDYGALGGADLCVLWKDWRGHTHLQVGSLTHRQSFVTALLKLPASADHLRAIPCTQMCMQVNRRHIIPVVTVTTTTFLCIF